MLLGRFAPEIFALGLAGSLARQQPVPASAGTLDTQHAAVRRHARRRHPHPGRPDLLPGARAGPVRGRTALMSVTTTPEAPAGAGKTADRSAAPDRRRPARPQDAVEVNAGRVQEAGPAGPAQEPGHVRRRGRRRADHLHGDQPSRRSSTGRSCVWLWLTVVFANLAEAVAEGRGKAQAETLRRTKRETVARRLRRLAARATGRGLCARRPCRAPSSRSVTTWWSRPARSSPATGTSSRASPRSTSRRSPASPRRSSASPAATGPRSPAAPRCCPTGSW